MLLSNVTLSEKGAHKMLQVGEAGTEGSSTLHALRTSHTLRKLAVLVTAPTTGVRCRLPTTTSRRFRLEEVQESVEMRRACTVYAVRYLARAQLELVLCPSVCA